jgi:hypothetical protein
MLVAHKVIEAIREGRLMASDKDIEHHAGLVADIMKAEKFDFGDLMLEPFPDKIDPPEWRLPN